MAHETYTLQGENEKLEQRARIFDRQSRPFLQRLISPGQHVFELGCGMGSATRIIAGLLDNTGSLSAIDVNPEYVQYVKEKLCQGGFQNVDIWQQDAQTIATESFYDLIYCRAVLHHIPDAKKVIDKLYNMLRPGGIIALEEPIMDTSITIPNNRNFTKLFDWYIQLGKLRNCDYLIGHKLPSYLQSSGMNVLESQIVQTMIALPQERQAIPDLIDTLKDQLIENKIASLAEIKTVKDDIEQITQSQNPIYNVQFYQIIGQK